MKEYEMKLLLTQEEYDCLYRHYMFGARRGCQINYYYDTPSFMLYRLGISYRVREREGRFERTVKLPHRYHRECREELSMPVTCAPLTAQWEDLALRQRGCLITDRTEMRLPDGASVCLDANCYLGKIDFELEVEYPEFGRARGEDALRSAAACLVRHGLISKPAELLSRNGKSFGKAGRFFTALTVRIREKSSDGSDSDQLLELEKAYMSNRA